MVLTLGGSTLNVAPMWRDTDKTGAVRLNNGLRCIYICLERIKLQISLHTCARLNELPSKLITMPYLLTMSGQRWNRECCNASRVKKNWCLRALVWRLYSNFVIFDCIFCYCNYVILYFFFLILRNKCTKLKCNASIERLIYAGLRIRTFFVESVS